MRRLARTDEILALLILLRKVPQAVKKMIRDLSNEEHVLVALDIRPTKVETG